MSKKVTLMVSDEAYDALNKDVPPRKRGAFVSKLVEAHYYEQRLAKQYQEAAKDKEREAEAKEWEAISLKDMNHAAW